MGLQRIYDLRNLLHRHNYLYYTLCKPEIADSQYDELLRELQELEEKFSEQFDLKSPTQTVGALPLEELKAMGIF